MTTRSTRSNKERLLEEFSLRSEPSATTEQPRRRQTRRHKENEASEDERPLVGKFVKYPPQTPVETTSSIVQKSKRNRAALKDKNETVTEYIPQNIEPVDPPAFKKRTRRTRSKKNVSIESFVSSNVKEQHVQEHCVKIANIPILFSGVDKSDIAKETHTNVSILKDKKQSKRRGKNKVKEVSREEFTLDLAVETDKPKTRKQEQIGQKSPLASANTSADSFHSAVCSSTHKTSTSLQTSIHSEKGLYSACKQNASNSTKTFNTHSFQGDNDSFAHNRVYRSKENTSSTPNTSHELVSTVAVTKQELSGSKYDNFTYDKTKKKRYSTPSSSSKEYVLNETFDKSPERRKGSCSSILNAAGKISEEIFATSIMLVDNSDDNNTIFFSGTKEKAKSDDKSSMEKSKLYETFQNNNLNETFDKSPKCSSANKIEINSESQKTTPVLVRGGTFTKETSKEITPTNQSIQSPLVQESTFTKEISSKQVTSKDQPVQTPARLKKSLAVPGSTPYHINKGKRTRSTDKSLTMLSVMHSLEKEKTLRRASTVVEAVRQTKVMFCSPVFNPAQDIERKSRVIKSSLKGSNKSFVHEEPSSVKPASSRKRSYTHGDVENVSAKRKKFNDELNASVNRLSRPKTATGRTEPPTTPNNKLPLRKSVSETKPSSVRSKVPDFAALHKKAFERMESLSECQERKAQRAQQILQFSSGQYSLDGRKSPIVNTSFKQTVQSNCQEKKEHVKIARPFIRQPSQKTEESATNEKTQSDEQEKKEAGKAKIFRPVTRPAPPKQESANTNGLGNQSYTRFGFKLNSDTNPFSIPSTKPNPFDVTTTKPKLVKQTTKEKLNHTVKLYTNTSKPSTKPLKPSQNGTVSGLPSLRREKSKNALIREITATAVTERKKRESRDIIKGVRTNRRFELQMKSRNMN